MPRESRPARLRTALCTAGLSLMLATLTLIPALVTPALAAGEACPNEVLRAENNSLELPDCRAYEMVSPLDKNGGNITPSQAHAAVSGEAVSYVSRESFAEPAGAMYESRYVSRRGPSGWAVKNVTPEAAVNTTNVHTPFEEQLLTPELTLGVLSSEVALPGGSTEATGLYLADLENGSYEEMSLAGGDEIEPGGASTDLSRIVFEESLGGVRHVYEWAGGQASRVDVAPDGVAFSSGARAGLHSVSDDGSRVVFYGPEGQLYLRENPEAPQSPVQAGECTVPADACTVEVSVSQRSPEDPNGPQSASFSDASSSGARVFFTSTAELTENADTGPADNAANLYEYDLETGVLTDLTVDSKDTDGASVSALVAAGEDGSYVYFVASGVLAVNENTHKDTAVAEQPNLYASHGGAVTFIATLAGADAQDWSGFGGPAANTVRVTPDGTHLAFESTRNLTGYDNEAAEPGECTSEECREVYLYDATTGALVCASCDPSGARPVGSAELGGNEWEEEDPELGEVRPEHVLHQFEGAFYARRNLSEDGSRLFFETPDALVPGANNGLENVYEYENGNVHAISDVAGDSASYFLDASASGNDVFIATADQLVPGDTDSRIDVYDARVGGGFPAVQSSPGCTSAAACRGPVSAAGPEALGPPASATFSGPGNLSVSPPARAPAVAPKRKTAAQVRAEKLAKALKACKRDRSKRKRVACEKSARKRYAAEKATKATKAHSAGYERRASR